MTYRRTDGQICQTAINLEGLNDHELAELTGDPSVHRDLQVMARTLIEARRLRSSGQIDRALGTEALFDRMYDTLPKSLRW